MNIRRTVPTLAFLALAVASSEPVLAQEAGARNDIRGWWELDIERTTEFAAEAGREVSPSVARQMAGMTLELNANSQFVQRLGETGRIEGTWSYQRESYDAGSKAGLLTLDPDIDDHEDMIFDIVFVSEEVIRASPRQGLATVFFTRVSKG